ncbi:hypothetical protein KAR28_05230 [Candidatus Parcubacteria bacterium]|nr:hypothetical protein [Candidatus Parcubacteria bacterium]
MKYTTHKLAIILVIMTFSAPSAHALFSDRVDMANKALTNGNKQIAKQHLAKVRNDSKASDKENYRAGLVYYESLHNYDDAHICFRKIKDYVYRKQVVAHYQAPADRAMKNRDFHQALHYYKKLAEIDKFQGLETVNIFFEKGRDLWLVSRAAPRNVWRVAYELEKFILEKDTTVTGDKIAGYYYKEFMNTDKPCYDCYELSLEFSSKYLEKIKKALSFLYNSEIPETHKTDLRNRIAKLAESKEELDELAPPDYIVVTEKSFIIDCPDGKPSKFYRTSTNNLNFFFNKGKDHFYLQLRSGKKISLEELKRKRAYIGTEDFRIVPTKNKPLDVGVEIL